MLIKIKKNHATFSFMVSRKIENFESFEALIRKMVDQSIQIFLDDFATIYENELIRFVKFENEDSEYHFIINI